MARQLGSDTEINRHTPADLVRVRGATGARILCRLNAFGAHTLRELDLAIHGGADEVLLPMVRESSEVERVLRLLDSRRPLGIMVETIDAVRNAAELARLPLSRVYIGLTDLAIERRSASIFEALVDGTIDRIRHHFTCEFGAAGATLPDKGHPIPAALLCGEIARLDCSFTFLRRSFLADTSGLSLDEHVPRIYRAFEAAFHRTEADVNRDRKAFQDHVRRSY
jgi:hypothetical protein